MREPEVGLPTILGAGCGFSIDLDKNACDARPVIHLAVMSPAWGIVALSSCAFHEDVARLTGEVLDEHRFDDKCAEVECWAMEPANA